MTRILLGISAVLMTSAVASAPAEASFEGRWTNPKRSLIIEVGRCGNAWCGTVVGATEKAKANARRGGTPNLIGTRVLTGVRPVGNGKYKGKAFAPKENVRTTATIRQLSDTIMLVEGCAVAGLICKEQRWTRVQ